MKDDKYRLWRVLHPDAWHCHYCRCSRERPHCPLLNRQDHKDCREFLNPKNYQIPSGRNFEPWFSVQPPPLRRIKE
jgi:hypothetical protein